ncbi:MAG: glycosyltransferase family 39 protein [Myxococcota bacterium]|jgi:4-amino-4-deoxy-L-arabinose transferase-like glycosyltransferase
MKNRPLAILLVFLAALTVVRMFLAATLELSPDEAYYYAWSLRPAAGYLDHPPMVAWMIHVATSVFGRSELAIRLPAILSGVLVPVIIYLTAVEAGAAASWALIATIVGVLTPLMTAGAIIVTPDTPLSIFWAAGALVLVRIVTRPASGLDMLAVSASLGVFMGLAMLSKYTGAALALVSVVMIIFIPWRRRGLIWLALIPAVVSLCVWLPNLVYNMNAGFRSMAFQWDHLFPWKLGEELKQFPEFMGGQIGVAGPFLFAGVLWVFKNMFSGEVAPGLRALQISTAIPLFVATFAALFGKVEPNWPAMAYIGAIPALAVMLSSVKATLLLKRTMIAAVTFGAVATTIITVHAAVPFLPIPADRDPVLQQLYGWREMTEGVLSHVRSAGDADRRVVTFSYRIASELYYYSGDKLETLCLDRRFTNVKDIPAGGAAKWITVEPYPAKRSESLMKLSCRKSYRRNGVISTWGDSVIRRVDVMWCE